MKNTLRIIEKNKQYNIGHICTKLQCELGRANDVAMLWISPSLSHEVEFTFQCLDQYTNQFANGLLELGFNEKDVIFTFLPKIPEQFIVFLGVLKIKGIAGTLFSNFGDEALLDRLGHAKAIVTKMSLLKKIQKIIPKLNQIKKIIVVDIDEDIDDLIVSFKKLINKSSNDYKVPLTSYDTESILHYTSGSTGKPKGVLHVHGAIDSIIHSAEEVLCLKNGINYWCTADQGWVTGTSYGIIGPWSLGVKQIHFGGGYDPQKWLSILQKEEVNIFYTAPTALRMLMRENTEFYEKYKLNHLKCIFSVGEPLNPEVINWSRNILSKEIYDTWFQTETGSIMIANKPGMKVKPGSMGRPLTNINAEILNEKGFVVGVNETGKLSIKSGWPSMFVKYLEDENQYSKKFINGYYLSGDMAYVDQEGYFWFLGRDDDVINTSGHLVSPFEVESSLLEMEEIVEAGVVGLPDDVLFEKVIAYVVLAKGKEMTKDLELKIRLHVNNRISSIASPSEVYKLDMLPKNRSGKVMRRILRARFMGQELGDISTLED